MIFIDKKLGEARDARAHVYKGFFSSNAGLPRKSDSPAFRPFDTLDDFRQDFQAIFIKPLICLGLSLYSTIHAFLELAATLIHFITFSPKAGEHFTRMYNALSLAFIHGGFCFSELLSATLSFTMRCSITVGVGVGHLATAIAGLFSSHAASREPIVPSAPPRDDDNADFPDLEEALRASAGDF